MIPQLLLQGKNSQSIFLTTNYKFILTSQVNGLQSLHDMYVDPKSIKATSNLCYAPTPIPVHASDLASNQKAKHLRVMEHRLISRTLN